MTRALNKVNTGEPPGDDKRGKKFAVSKTPNEKMELVRGHISSFPSYQSHLLRTHNPNRQCLSENLNIRLMYNLYKDHVVSEGNQPVEEHIYRRAFNEYNLHFHASHKDIVLSVMFLQVNSNVQQMKNKKQNKTSTGS